VVWEADLRGFVRMTLPLKKICDEQKDIGNYSKSRIFEKKLYQAVCY
jgi:hypothetical protein